MEEILVHWPSFAAGMNPVEAVIFFVWVVLVAYCVLSIMDDLRP